APAKPSERGPGEGVFPGFPPDAGILPVMTAMPACNPRRAINASASREPGARPTPSPIACRILSILVLTFRKAMAHRNQTKRFPETVSLPWEATAFCTSDSDTAKTGSVQLKKQTTVKKIDTLSFRSLLFPIVYPSIEPEDLPEIPPPYW